MMPLSEEGQARMSVKLTITHTTECVLVGLTVLNASIIDKDVA